MTMTKEEAQKAYDDLVAYRKQNVLTKSKEHLGMIEEHHIIPVSINGFDLKENKVMLLAKEHFMAHVYLWIIHHDDEFHDQMLCALMNMHKGTINGNRKELRDFILMSEDYQQAREEFGKFASKILSEANKGNKNSQYGKHWIRNPITKESKLINNNEILPDGWEYGRYCNITKKRICSSTQNKIAIYNFKTNTLKYINIFDDIPKGFKKCGRPMSQKDKQKALTNRKNNFINKIVPKRIAELKPMYEYYLQFGWESFKEHFNYQYTWSNFIGSCKKYLVECTSTKIKHSKI